MILPLLRKTPVLAIQEQDNNIIGWVNLALVVNIWWQTRQLSEGEEIEGSLDSGEEEVIIGKDWELEEIIFWGKMIDS